MRLDIIRCDVCKKEHDAQYVLPPEWYELKQGDVFGNQEERHFCSVKCLMKWANDRGIQVEVIEE